METPSIKIPATIKSHKNKPERTGMNEGKKWQIYYCLEKLKAKYGADSYNSLSSLEYDKYMTNGLNDKSWPNQIFAADIAMTTIMNSKMDGDNLSYLIRNKDQIEKILKTIPVDVSLVDLPFPEAEAYLKPLFKTIIAKGIKMSKVTKLLYLKRPRLIPILDRYVMAALWEDYGNDSISGINALNKFSVILKKHKRDLLLLSNQLSDWLKEEYNEDILITPVRVLESLIWFDYLGYENFDKEFEFEDNVIRPRVVAKNSSSN